MTALFETKCYLLAVFLLLGKGSLEASDPIDLAMEAVLALDKTTGGTAEGSFEFYVHDKNGTTASLVERANVKTVFEGEDSFLRLDYTQARAGTTRRIIIRNNGLLLTSKFAVADGNNWAQGYIYDAKPLRKPRVAEFPWDISRLRWAVLDLQGLLKKHPKGSFPVNPVDGGIYRAIIDSGATRLEFDISPDYGYNICSRRDYSVRSKTPVIQIDASWKKHGNRWYVSRIKEKRDFREFKGICDESILEFSSFQENVPIALKTMGIESLDLPRGTRILDQRPDAQERYLYYGGRKNTDQDYVDSMIQQIGNDGIGDSFGVNWRFMFGTLAALLIVTGVALRLYFWRKKRNLIS